MKNCPYCYYYHSCIPPVVVSFERWARERRSPSSSLLVLNIPRTAPGEVCRLPRLEPTPGSDRSEDISLSVMNNDKLTSRFGRLNPEDEQSDDIKQPGGLKGPPQSGGRHFSTGFFYFDIFRHFFMVETCRKTSNNVEKC